MTDGYVGNDMEIIGEVKKHPNARVFAFGIGSSVNHFLLDQMAREGRGEVEYVGLEDDGSAAARRFQERVRTPLLTDLRLEWSGVSTSEIYPARLPDLFSAKPLIVSGRYDSRAGELCVSAEAGGPIFVREVPVVLPADQPAHPVWQPCGPAAK
jgi:Ca-activated chloride channel family protein